MDRHLRSLSRHRLGRRVTFQEPEIELDPSERPYRGPWGHSFGIHPEDNNGIPPFTQRQETVLPLEMPIAYLDVGGRGNYLPQPSIRNIEVWLNWQACQLDMPHWWVELTAIPNVERLAKETSPENPCLFFDPSS